MVETLTQLTCLRCNHTWWPKSPAHPKNCPKCKSPYWNKPRGNDVNNAEKAIDHPVHCFRCGHNWRTTLERPTQCPACHSSYWDKPRQDTNTVKEERR